jgi:hypothetical protein
MRSRTIWLASPSVFLAAACGVTGPGSSALTIDMSVTAFTRLPLSQAVFIPFQLRNHDSVTVYVPGCGPDPVLVLQQLTSAGWQDIPPDFYCISAAPVALMPGAVLADGQACTQTGTLRLTVSYRHNPSGPTLFATGPQFTVQ